VKLPYIKFYVRDWMMSIDLRRCSYAARGLWIEMMCLMSMDRYGYLEHNGEAINEAELESLTMGLSVGDNGRVKGLLAELEQHKVFSRDENGCIYSRRMVADYEKRCIFEEYGKHGGNPRLTKRPLKGEDKNITQNPEPTLGLTQGVNPPCGSPFDEFWKDYPKKIGKGAAWKAFGKASKITKLPILLAAIKLQARSEQWQKAGGQFVPTPATWLNEERWNDEVMMPASKSPTLPARLSPRQRYDAALHAAVDRLLQVHQTGGTPEDIDRCCVALKDKYRDCLFITDTTGTRWLLPQAKEIAGKRYNAQKR